jgi:hypothetical protein
MLKVRQVPNPWSATQGMEIFDGSDGYMYDEHDVKALCEVYEGQFKTRKTKYGTTYYFPGTIKDFYDRKEGE